MPNVAKCVRCAGFVIGFWTTASWLRRSDAIVAEQPVLRRGCTQLAYSALGVARNGKGAGRGEAQPK